MDRAHPRMNPDHVTFASAKFDGAVSKEMHLHENTEFDLNLGDGVKSNKMLPSSLYIM